MAVVFEPDAPETRRALNQLARLKAITRLETDILADMMICEIEGWDKTEYISMIKERINNLGGG